MVLEQRALTIVIVNFVFLGLSTITLALRCLVRVTREAFGLDDWMILLGWIIFVMNVSMSTMSAIHGLGVHNLTITAAEMEPAVKYFTLFQLFTLTGTLPVKASICISLMRITPSLTYRKILYAIMAGSVATVLISDIAVIVTCRPMAFTWDKTIPDGKCSSINAILILSYCFSGMNIITDWSTALIPRIHSMELETLSQNQSRHQYSLRNGSMSQCSQTITPFRLGNGSYGPSDDRPSPPTIATPHKKGYMKARAIRLRNIEDGLATTMVTEAGNDTADNYNESINASDGDKSSQRGILQHIPEHPEPKCTGKEVGILVTQIYKIENEDTEDNVSKDRGCKYNGNNESRERTIQDIV
ncbi:uncharacterized protein EAF02_000808 [Botrytis sinoallii]|uniref:uncharacterized protein n=1 Tax=Botrytis sinoallii TaxID=1463999 RepID=UPI0018FF8374|nr:uncharacterized protein EAF02_000808 [Botrytis sinoallii]KAF7893270.1 hypothetical protein EAF02_000808 [Botrytis sinoallii]